VSAGGVLGDVERLAGEADHDHVAVGIAPGDGVVFQRGLELQLADVRAVLFVLRVPEGDAGDFDAVAREHGYIERSLVVFAVAFVVAGDVARECRRGDEQQGEAER